MGRTSVVFENARWLQAVCCSSQLETVTEHRQSFEPTYSSGNNYLQLTERSCHSELIVSMMSWDWWKLNYGEKCSWSRFRCYPRYLSWRNPRKTTKSVELAGFWAEIWSPELSKKTQKFYALDSEVCNVYIANSLYRYSGTWHKHGKVAAQRMCS